MSGMTAKTKQNMARTTNYLEKRHKEVWGHKRAGYSAEQIAQKMKLHPAVVDSELAVEDFGGPAMSMSASSSVQGTGPIATYDPRLNTGGPLKRKALRQIIGKTNAKVRRHGGQS